MQREYNYEILPEIQRRYAVIHFSDDKLTRADVLPVIEAARYAPSCFNEQPWRFILGDNERDHAKLAKTLNAGNAWAKQAPVLILVLATKTFKLNGKDNAFYRYDTGTASGFLQLEAVRRGLAVHCMAGFSAEKARQAFDISPELDIISMIAMGRPAPPEILTAQQLENQKPGTRNALDTFVLN